MAKKTLFVDQSAPQIPLEQQINFWIASKSSKEPLSPDKIQQLLTFLVRTRNFESNQQQLDVLDATFPPIYNSIVSSEGLGDYKTMACDSLVVWISRSIQLLNKFPPAKSTLQSHISINSCQYLFHYVLDFWNDSGAALGNSLRELFVKLIAFISLTSESKEAIFKSWLVKSLQLPHSMRVFYFMVEHLYKEVQPLDFVFTQQPNFVENSLNYIWSNALASNVGRVVFLLLRHVKPLFQNELDWVKFWANDLINAISQQRLKRPIESYLLPNLFKISTPATMIFLKYVISTKSNDVSTVLSCLKIAQESSILIEPFLPSSKGEEPVITIDAISLLLKSTNGTHRVGAFSLLVSSPKMSKEIPTIVYQSVLKSLDSIYVDNDMETRNEMFSYLHKFVCRIRDSVYALDRDAKSLTKKNFEKFQLEIKAKESAVSESIAFFKALIDILKMNMKPGSSFQRKEMSLRILKMIINAGLDNRVDKKHLEKSKSVSFSISIDIYDTLLVRLLIDNICDDFEDVRTTSTSLLNMCPLPIHEIIDIETTKNRAMELLGDMKGKSVDSGARFFQFLYFYYQSSSEKEQCKLILEALLAKIKFCIAEAERDICTACYSYGIQGYFAAFKFIFEIIDYKQYSMEFNNQLSDELIELASASWNQVKSVLQHDSPEGNMPQEMKERYSKELEAKYGKGTQVILSYAWRAMKESTIMIEIMLRRSEKSRVLKDETIIKLGPDLIEQLSTIRHRGAFSSVYPTFVALCALCKITPSLEPLPRKWLEDNVEQTKIKTKSITRRSAGIPYLNAAILTSYHELMEWTFGELLKISTMPIGVIESNINLPQVNAYNCIKVLFIDSSLSDYSVYYVDQSLNLALNAISSPIWSIRNCAVMLFTALQNRLFSSKKVKSNQLPTYPARLFFNKFKNVKSIFYETLKSVSDDESNLEKIFPILTIMSRLEPTPDYNGLDEFNVLLVKFLSSKVWKVREMAARSYPSMVASREQFKEKFVDLLRDNDLDDNNLMHGSLLAQREMLQRVDLEAYQGDELLIYDPVIRNNVLDVMDVMTTETCPWPFKLVAFQNLKLIKFGEREGDESYITTLRDWYQSNFNVKRNLDGAIQLTLRECLEILLDIYYKKKRHGELITLLEESLFADNYELQLASIEFISQHTDTFSGTTLVEFGHSCWKLLGQAHVWKHVKSNALVLLKDLNIRIPIDDFDVSKHLFQLIEYSNDPNEEIRLATIETLGSFIAKAIQAGESQNGFSKWISMVKCMGDDENESQVRSSALNSLIGFQKVYLQNGEDKLVSFGVLGLIFNYLSDDDDELAVNASRYLWNTILEREGDVLPIEVEKSMVEYVITALQDDLSLTEVVLGVENECKWYSNAFRLIGASKLEDVLSTSDLLFGSEKRNLDRDMTLRSLNAVKIIKEVFGNKWDDHLEPLKELVNDNLNAINVKILHGDHVSDGPLGFLSQEAVFGFVYDNILIGQCLSQQTEMEEFELARHVIRGDDQWHEMIYKMVELTS